MFTSLSELAQAAIAQMQKTDAALEAVEECGRRYIDALEDDLLAD